MATQNLDFGAQIDAWVKKTEGRTLAVFRESTKRLLSQCQARGTGTGIPVDTGFARASLQVSLDSLPQVSSERPQAGQTYAWSDNGMSAVIAGAQLGSTIYAGWTANYAIYLEYGHSRQAPSGFVRINALQWPQIVAQVANEAKKRTGA